MEIVKVDEEGKAQNFPSGRPEDARKRGKFGVSGGVLGAQGLGAHLLGEGGGEERRTQKLCCNVKSFSTEECRNIGRVWLKRFGEEIN
jgi:hypothetical protein